MVPGSNDLQLIPGVNVDNNTGKWPLKSTILC